jgi:hypothetical protein
VTAESSQVEEQSALEIEMTRLERDGYGNVLQQLIISLMQQEKGCFLLEQGITATKSWLMGQFIDEEIRQPAAIP